MVTPFPTELQLAPHPDGLAVPLERSQSVQQHPSEPRSRGDFLGQLLQWVNCRHRSERHSLRIGRRGWEQAAEMATAVAASETVVDAVPPLQLLRRQNWPFCGKSAGTAPMWWWLICSRSTRRSCETCAKQHCFGPTGIYPAHTMTMRRCDSALVQAVDAKLLKYSKPLSL